VSAYIAPLLWIHGMVRSVTEREVPAIPAVEGRPAVPAEYDETGALIHPAEPEVRAREGRPAYTVHDVVVDTMQEGSTVPAGFVEVVITPGAAEATEGYLPGLGEQVIWPVRGFQKWYGAPGRRRSTNGYSFAGDVYAAASDGRGARLASAS
jgi:hypothetical protein